MRTREERISALAFEIDGVQAKASTKRYVEQHLLEAERRAEQRVREEIARDSERLDWLLAHSHYGIPGFDPVVSGRTPEKRRADLIRAIDAAREVG